MSMNPTARATSQAKQRKQARKRIDAAKVNATKPTVLDTSRKLKRKISILELVAKWQAAWNAKHEVPEVKVRKAPLSLPAFLSKWRETKVAVFPISETRLGAGR